MLCPAFAFYMYYLSCCANSHIYSRAQLLVGPYCQRPLLIIISFSFVLWICYLAITVSVVSYFHAMGAAETSAPDCACYILYRQNQHTHLLFIYMILCRCKQKILALSLSFSCIASYVFIIYCWHKNKRARSYQLYSPRVDSNEHSQFSKGCALRNTTKLEEG